MAPQFIINIYHFLWPAIGAFLYGFPSRKLTVIGVTGTNGKSTVVEMCHNILSEAGLETASISSVRFKIKNSASPNTLKMTMPGRFALQKFLKAALRAKCQYVVLEVTSEGLKQHRHRFIEFDVAVLTNLTPEHIESHGGFEKYKKAKGELFFALQAKSQKNKKISIVNLDDGNAEYFLNFAAHEKYGYRVKRQEVEIANTQELKIVEAQNVETHNEGISFLVNNFPFRVSLRGEFNVYNALAAICVGLSQGIDIKTIEKALEKLEGVPGRMEVVAREPFTVIVDYAHTPDALEKVYHTIKSLNPRSHTPNPKLICVLGSAGGGRDKWKRPIMGNVASQYCDDIILTNEDPYDEDPARILSEIKSGIQSPKFNAQNLHEMPDRREAIQFALKGAHPGDWVIITGKGSEPWMCLAGGRKIPWDDRRVVREELRHLY